MGLRECRLGGDHHGHALDLKQWAAGQGVDGQDEAAYGEAKHRSQSCVVRVCSRWVRCMRHDLRRLLEQPE